MTEFDSDTAGTDGRTPLLWLLHVGARLRGCSRDFLGTDGANPDWSDKYNQTPLSFAAEFRPKGAVDILMK